MLGTAGAGAFADEYRVSEGPTAASWTRSSTPSGSGAQQADRGRLLRRSLALVRAALAETVIGVQGRPPPRTCTFETLVMNPALETRRALRFAGWFYVANALLLSVAGVQYFSDAPRARGRARRGLPRPDRARTLPPARSARRPSRRHPRDHRPGAVRADRGGRALRPSGRARRGRRPRVRPLPLPSEQHGLEPADERRGRRDPSDVGAHAGASRRDRRRAVARRGPAGARLVAARRAPSAPPRRPRGSAADPPRRGGAGAPRLRRRDAARLRHERDALPAVARRGSR